MPKCNHCKKDFTSKSEFKLKGVNRYSPYCTLCRDIATVKVSEDGKIARAYSPHEEKLIKKYLKSLSAKEKREKLPVSRGKIIVPA